MAASFTITKKLKRPKCLSTDEWVYKMWYIHKMAYHLPIKRNELLTHAASWMETSCYVKEATHKGLHILWFHLYEMLRIGNFMEKESRLVVSGARGPGSFGGWLLICVGFLSREMKTFQMNCGDGCTTWESTKKHWIAYFKWVDCMVCEYLNKSITRFHVLWIHHISHLALILRLFFSNQDVASYFPSSDALWIVKFLPDLFSSLCLSNLLHWKYILHLYLKMTLYRNENIISQTKLLAPKGKSLCPFVDSSDCSTISYLY